MVYPKIIVVVSDRLESADMANGYFIQQRKRHAWQRTISIVLLALCFFDLAITDVFFLGTCEQENEMRSVAVATTTTQTPTVNTQSESEHSQTPGESSGVEEDCLCCCAHIVPVALYKYPHPSLHIAPVISALSNIPSAPSVELDPPPRFV
ncbi:MAG: hypothetical protein JST84_00270 [Acidobacteria bacterium]|nr:hypothetical protein [Acidobacteriota bacterium]